MKQGATLVPLANGRLYRLRHRHFSARARACTRVQFARGVVNVSSPGTGFRTARCALFGQCLIDCSMQERLVTQRAPSHLISDSKHQVINTW
jgi:hypothetical protein